MKTWVTKVSKHDKSAYLNIHLTIFLFCFLVEINAFNHLGLGDTSEATKSISISFKKMFRQLHVFPLNHILNMNKSCNLQCSGNKMHWIVANMMLFHYLHVKLTLLWRTRISGELPLFQIWVTSSKQFLATCSHFHFRHPCLDVLTEKETWWD